MRDLILSLSGWCCLLIVAWNVLSLDSIHNTATIVEQSVVFNAHGADDIPLIIWITKRAALVVRCQTVVVTRELLQLVSELVVLSIWSTHHANVLALQILQTLLPDFVGVQIYHLITALNHVLPWELATRAVFAILNDLALGVQLCIGEVTAGHVAHITLVVLIALFIPVHLDEARAHFLSLICERLGTGTSLVSLLLLLLIVDSVSCHLLLPDQVPFRKVHHAFAQGLIELLMFQYLIALVADINAIVRICPRIYS